MWSCSQYTLPETLLDRSPSKLSKKWQISKKCSGNKTFFKKAKEASELFSKHGGSLEVDRMSTVFTQLNMVMLFKVVSKMANAEKNGIIFLSRPILF